MKYSQIFSAISLPASALALFLVASGTNVVRALESETVAFPQERRIWEVLAEPYHLPAMTERPLIELVADLRRVYHINCSCDERALESIGMSSDCLFVTTPERQGSLGASLTELLGELDLTFVIRNETLLITTPDDAAASMSVRIHDVTSLVASNHSENSDVAALINTLTDSIAPVTWEASGTGEGKISSYHLGDRWLLIIRQTIDVHVEIDRYLSTLAHFGPAPMPNAKASRPRAHPSQQSPSSQFGAARGTPAKRRSPRKYVRATSEVTPQIHEMFSTGNQIVGSG